MTSDIFDHLFVEPGSFDATVSFYRDGLGWAQEFAWGQPGEPRGIGLSGGGARIVLAERHPAADHSKSHGINGTRPTIHLVVADTNRHRVKGEKVNPRPNRAIDTDVLAAGFARLWPAGDFRRSTSRFLRRRHPGVAF